MISDRFLLANVVYQSVGGNVPAERLWEMGRWANNGLAPDLTILMDMPAEDALKRLDRATDRMESRGLQYMQSVRDAFLVQLNHTGGRTALVNAGQSVDDVTSEIQAHVAAFLDR